MMKMYTYEFFSLDGEWFYEDSITVRASGEDEAYAKADEYAYRHGYDEFMLVSRR